LSDVVSEKEAEKGKKIVIEGRKKRERKQRNKEEWNGRENERITKK
jgi:hypothetical protein